MTPANTVTVVTHHAHHGLTTVTSCVNLWPMYRPSVNTPETAWGRHLDKVMRDRDWSRVRLFEEVGSELGYSPKSRSALLPFLVAKEPDERQAAVLRKHFGDPPAVEPVADQPPSGDAALIAAMTAQTTAITALVEELRLARERDLDAAAAILRAAELLRPPTPGVGAGSTERSAPLGSTG